MNTFELMNFMEQLRIKRRITQEEFLFDIVSPRQYQRYRNGISTVPIDVITKMNNRLGVDNRKIFAEFEIEKYREKTLVDSIYNLVVLREFDKAKEEIQANLSHVFIQKENRDLYSLSNLLLKLETNEINVSLFLEGVYRIADYPNILKVEVVTEIELLCLTLIYLKNPYEKEKIIKRFILILNGKNEVISGMNLYTHIQVLFYITKYLGEKKHYDEVIKYSMNAIDLLKRHYSIYQLDYFYYYISIAYSERQELVSSNLYLYKCINLVLHSGSEEYIRRMFGKIEEKLQIDPMKFFMQQLVDNIKY